MRSKKLVFVSNYLSHYSKSLSEAFIRLYQNDFAFIAMTPFNSKRLSAGFTDLNQLPFVLRAYENNSSQLEANRLILDADCLIVGGMPVQVVRNRLVSGKITFMQSERFFKGPFWKDAGRFLKYSLYSGGRLSAKDLHSKFFLLCASAYAAEDYKLCGLFKGKAYRWGYFPEVKLYQDFDALLARKTEHSILWVGRLLPWKHPELAIDLADRLRARGKSFSIKIIGSGEMQDTLANMIHLKHLDDCVHLLGSLPVQNVREEMEKAQIFLFTSDRAEGWGVVLNEAMNSACAVVADERTGSAPYLVRHGVNGFLYRRPSLDNLTNYVDALLSRQSLLNEFATKAYCTISQLWSPDNAAARFHLLAEFLNSHDKHAMLWQEGPATFITP